MRRLAIDPGAARIGLARSDDEGRIAFPAGKLEGLGWAAAAARIAEIVAADSVGEVVVGLPLSLSGEEGAAARRVRRFVREVEKAVDVPVVLWDERLTTVAAERALSDAGVRAREQRDVVDETAATILLQSYLDAQQDRPWPPNEDRPDPAAVAAAPADPGGLGKAARRPRRRGAGRGRGRS